MTSSFDDQYRPYPDGTDPYGCDEHEALERAGMAEGLPLLSDLTQPLPVSGDPLAEEDDPDKPSLFTRRRFVQALVAAGALGYGVTRGASPAEQANVQSPFASQRAATGLQTASLDDLATAAVRADGLDGNEAGAVKLVKAAPVDQRVLVLIELAGGNDGASMVVPYGSGVYYDRRPRLAIAGEDVHALDSEVGLAPGLVRLAGRQLATVEGVGPVNGSLSHFDMARRWEMGDLLAQGGQRAGFLARVASTVDTGAAVTGLSVAGHSPRLEGAGSSLVLENLYQLSVLTKDDFIFPAYRQAVRSFGGGPRSAIVAQSWQALAEVGRSLNSNPDINEDSLMIREGGGLGRQLAMASAMIRANVGVKVIHAKMGGFDTHENHPNRHNQLMTQLGAAIDGFFTELEAAGVDDRVLVATSSEFGRRLSQNGSGLDHGSASAMLLVGPIKPGRGGDPPALNDLDGNGNLKTTIPFDRYLGSLAEDWLGVGGSEVLPGSPVPLGLV